MNSSTSSSDRLRALVLALTLVFGGEAALAWGLPPDPGRHVVDRLLAAIERRPPPADPVVAWADSVTDRAVARLQGELPLVSISSTQAISMGGVYFTVRRLVRRGARPRVVWIAVIPESLGNDLRQVFTRTYFETCFLRLDEISDHARRTGRWGQAARMLGHLVLVPPSVRRRGAVRDAVRGLRGSPEHPAARLPRGRLAGLDPAVLDELRQRGRQQDFRLSDVSRVYLAALDELAREHDFEVHLTLGAVPASVAAGWRESGYLDGVRERISASVDPLERVHFDPELHFATWPDEQMYDRVHLKPGAVTEYSRRLGAYLRVRWPELLR